MQNPTPVKSATASPAQQQTSSPKPNRIFAQAIGGLNGATSRRDRSRSRSPEKKERRPRQRTPERPSSSSSSSFTILSRLGRPNDREVSVNSSDGKCGLTWLHYG